MCREDIALLIFAVLMAFVIMLGCFWTPKQELGWLAQKQIQARQDCAELIKYRMRW